MEDFFDLAHERYSVRRFSEEQIKKEELDRILEVARVSPTAHNNQPQKIIVLQSEEAISKAREVTKYAFNAPTILIICADRDEEWHGNDGHRAGATDAAIVTTSMMFQAFDEGIGSCWVRGFDEPTLREAFEIPENYEIVAMLPLGYPSEKSRPAPGWHDVRKPIEEMVKYI
ncbi:MAG: nitroreductase family protein [Firmicutes bacterium]|nr:nitroreductase family protein [Bacillota bacterium]